MCDSEQFVNNRNVKEDHRNDDTITTTNQEIWFEDRLWAISGNNQETNPSTLATSIFMPTSAEEIASIIKREPSRPVAAVCGGHEASNAALIANENAIIVDLKKINTISFHGNEVTVGGGVLFKELAEKMQQAGNFALPVGTGAEVGVVGYLVNGGISGYFSRRLGLLSQRVLKMTVVDSRGHILNLTPDDGERFTAMLGAGGAFGVVTEVTILMDDASILREARQYVLVSEDSSTLVRFSRWAIEFMRDKVLPDESVSMEAVTTGTNAVVITVVFYDAFRGSPVTFCEPIVNEANKTKLTLASESTWNTWFQVASALWPVIEEMKGKPLAMLQHCCGTKGSPNDSDLDFIENTWIKDAPLKEAIMTIVEVRTLGGAIKKGRIIPSGNFHHDFFVDVIVAYDAGQKTIAERKKIAEKTNNVVSKARQQKSLVVDFSGTHSQLDDTNHPVRAKEIFGDDAMAQKIISLKEEIDPSNRFRFHPYSKIL